MALHSLIVAPHNKGFMFMRQWNQESNAGLYLAI